MTKAFRFWIYAATTTQILTGIMHSLSLFAPMQATNNEERMLIEMVTGYHMDMGMGFNPTYADLFTALSSCFTLLCLFGGILNLFLWRKKVDASLWNGILTIEAGIFGICFAMMLFNTFLPPIVLSGLIFVFLTGGMFSVGRARA